MSPNLRPTLRRALLALPVALVPALLPAPARALCRCVCVLGQMRAVCQPTDLVTPICQALCESDVRPERVTRPLAGGMPVNEPVRPFNPAPGQLAEPDFDLNTDARGFQLGTAGSLTGAGGGAGSGGSAAAAASGGR